MTPLGWYAEHHGATIRPHPATEPVPRDGGVVVVTASDIWQSIDELMGDEKRTGTSAAILVAPGLQRSGFVP